MVRPCFLVCVVTGWFFPMLISMDANAAERSRAFRKTQSESACQLQSGGESVVLAVAAPQTLRLADGRFVRLAEILVPTSPYAVSSYDPSALAVDTLRKVALGKRVEVKFDVSQRDRYGVNVGHVFVTGEQPLWLQDVLVTAGFAVTYPTSDHHNCTKQLLASEAAAREAKRGNWGSALTKVFAAGEAKSLMPLLQTYQIVEGKVVETSEKSGRLTLHFGADAQRDFAVTLEPAVTKALAQTGATANWKGSTVRVRGWLDRRRGPVMTVSLSGQIELVAGRQD